jgi:TadE-like protein
MSRRRDWRAGVADDRGVSAVEFAILLLPLSICLLGMLDAGYSMYVRSDLQGALNDVARQATVETPGFGGTGTVAQQIDTALQSRMAKLVTGGTYTISKSSYYQFNSIGKPEKLITDVDGDGKYDSGDCFQDINHNGTYDTNGTGYTGVGGADDIVVYDVTLTMNRLLPMASLIGLPAQQTVRVKTTVRNQPYANQASPPTVC